MDRRKFIRSSVLGASAASLTTGGSVVSMGQVVLANPQDNPFKRQFFVPLIELGRREGDQVHFDLNISTGLSNFIGNLSTPTIGVNSPYLGPTLRVKRGDRVFFSVKNNLAEEATLHWHGFVLPACMDGGPHQVIMPGQTWHSEFDIIQPAATYWYHSHTHKLTGRQVYHGLAGLFLVDDDLSLNSGLPIDYGIDDIPVIIQDRDFNRDGSFNYLGSMMDQMQGMRGNTILVNGVVTPTFKANRALNRLRLLNASNARTYDLAFHDSRPFVVIAGDGGFLAQSVKVKTIRLSPGERIEILVDMSNGQDAILRNAPVKHYSGGGNSGMNSMMGGMMRKMMGNDKQAFNILKIVAPRSVARIKFKKMPDFDPHPGWEDVVPVNKRKFQLEMQMGPKMMMSKTFGGNTFSINGDAMDLDVINLRVKSETFEIWEIANSSMLAHPFHIHNTQFKIIARSNRSIAAAESGLKDTVLVYPQERVRLLIPFLEYSDHKSPYMYHCHILEHEDGGMMGQFTVEA